VLCNCQLGKLQYGIWQVLYKFQGLASGSNELIWSNSGLCGQNQKQWMCSSLSVACAVILSHSSKIPIMMKLVTDHEITIGTTAHTTTVLRPFFWNHSDEPVPEQTFGKCQGRLTEADTQTIWLGATPSGLISAHLHDPPIFLQVGCLSCLPTNSVKALKARNNRR